MVFSDYLTCEEGKVKTAVVRMERTARPRTIDLVGVMHLGHPDYFADIRERLRDPEIVL